MKKFLWLIIMTMGVVSILKAQTSIEIEPKGVYKEIDVEKHNNVIKILSSKRYKSQATEREVDWFKIGFSPRKANLSIYLATDITVHTKSLKKLGKHKTGPGC